MKMIHEEFSVIAFNRSNKINKYVDGLTPQEIVDEGIRLNLPASFVLNPSIAQTPEESISRTITSGMVCTKNKKPGKVLWEKAPSGGFVLLDNQDVRYILNKYRNKNFGNKSPIKSEKEIKEIKSKIIKLLESI